MSGRAGILVQIRVASTRLPSKALLEIEGLTIARHVMRALAGVPAAVHALVTDHASSGALAGEASAEGYELFVGPADDVLRRYSLAAARFDIDNVVRATGDNPLVSPRLAREILDLHVARGADLSHFLGCPLGTGVEVIARAALVEADERSTEREHITQYLYAHRDRFRVEEPDCPADCLLRDEHVSIDTPEDYARLSRIFASLYDGRPIETDRLVRWLGQHAA